MNPTSMKRLNQDDLQDYRNLMLLFAIEFEEDETYQKSPPSDQYVRDLLANKDMIFLVAKQRDVLAGGLVAYVLRKFEQERTEVYIYDLAVKSCFRRQGIATSLINTLKPIAAAAGAWVIYVQADQGDEPAIKLYESVGSREEVLHFDIMP